MTQIFIVLLLSLSKSVPCLPSQAFPLLLVCLLLGEESNGKQHNWSDILMKHFLGSTQTPVNHSSSICLFPWGGLISNNPIEFKCLHLNLLRKKQKGIWKNKLYGRRVSSIDLLHKKKNSRGIARRNFGMQPKCVLLLLQIISTFPKSVSLSDRSSLKSPVWLTQ